MMNKNHLEAMAICGIVAVVDLVSFGTILPTTITYSYPGNMISVIAGSILLMVNIYAVGVALGKLSDDSGDD